VAANATIVAVAAVAMWLVDRKDFPNIWLGLWWAVQTATTVGYGDVTPKTVAGRLIGAVVMLQGIAFLAVVTASITSTFVARAQRELGEVPPGAEALTARLDEIDRRLEAIGRALGDVGVDRRSSSEDDPRDEQPW
jgi:voltage-gated potassium channel